jgi:hypothetical protein
VNDIDLPGTGTDMATVIQLRPRTSLSRHLLPESVWESSQVMAHIKQAALARLVCPDAVLHCVMATVASLLNHGSRLETGKGNSSLTHFVAAVGKSGAGKTEAMKVARELLATWTSDRFAITGNEGYFDGPLGSGEGMVEAFMGEVKTPKLDESGQEKINPRTGYPQCDTKRTQVRHNALFCSDEGRQALAIDARKGSTLFAVLCELWSGAMAGQTNAEANRTRKVEADSYTIGLLLGFQPSTIEALFADEAGGAPQRFAFVPAEYEPYANDLDSDIVDEWPGQLELDISVAPVVITLTREQQAEVRRSIRLKAAGLGDDNPLDGHRMLLRCRVAALLSLLHGKTAVSEDIWRLANVLVTVSCQMRDRLSELGEQRKARERRARRADAVGTAVEAAREVEASQRLSRATTILVRHLEGGPMTAGRLRNKSPRYRDVADAAIKHALDTGMIATDDDGKTYRLPD